MYFINLPTLLTATLSLITALTPLSLALPAPPSATLAVQPVGVAHPNDASSSTGQIIENDDILYHNGIIMNNGPIDINIIYYGDWQDAAEQNIVQNFFANVDQTPWFLTLTQYHDAQKANISGPITMASVGFNQYSLGKQLTKQNHQDIVADAINSNVFSENENALYYVLSSKDVQSEGFCTDYCGYHGHMSLPNSSKQLKFAYVGNAETLCPQGCAVGNPSVSPNGNVGIDGMVNIMAHEFIEALNDPFLSAWFDDQGQEAADKCNFNYGQQQTDNNLKFNFNMIVGGIKYLIQQNWSPDASACVIGS